MRYKLTRIVTEPLTQFLLIGVAIYAAYGFFGTPDNTDNERTVTVTAGEIQAMASQWLKLWNRPPTDDELAGVIRDHVKVLILSQEAVAMGLDDGDVVIQRRLAQKLQYLADSLITPEEPTEREMAEWYATNSEKFKAPDLYTITHVFFDPDKRDATALEDAAASQRSGHYSGLTLLFRRRCSYFYLLIVSAGCLLTGHQISGCPVLIHHNRLRK